MAGHDISQRRACRLVSVDPKTVRCEPEPDNPEIRVRMRDIAGERRRFGYRRIGPMLEREGIEMNHKKLRRLYREEGLALVADTSLSGGRVARELDAVIRLYGKPELVVSDNGTELTSRAILEWRNESGVGWHDIAPGKPQQNGFIKSVSIAPVRAALWDGERGGLLRALAVLTSAHSCTASPR
jgi:putative transposase